MLLDLGLPDLDGVDALRMVRTVLEVPVIVATAHDEEATARAGGGTLRIERSHLGGTRIVVDVPVVEDGP